MKWGNTKLLAFACSVALAVVFAGCGGSSNVNVVTVSVSPSSVVVIAGQVQSFTATVNGTTNLTVTNWPCTYSYVPFPTASIPNPKAVTGTCTSGGTISGVTGSIGTWVISTANGSNVLTYTAPSLSNFPTPTPTLTFTATSDANKSKTGTATVNLDSGIRASITPTSATVPVGLPTPQNTQFSAVFQNTNSTTAVYHLVQPNTANTTNVNDQIASPLADTCDPTCGTITPTGVYSAPATLPTDTKPSGSKSTSPTTVYVVAYSSQDIQHYAIAVITLVDATTHPLSYSGLYPTTIAAGGLLQDVYLTAKNLQNTVQIEFIPPTAAADLPTAPGSQLNSSTQIFTVPVSNAYCTPSATGVKPVITCDASILTRVRLQAQQLRQAEPDPMHPAWIRIPNLPGTLQAQGDCQAIPSADKTSTSIACPIHIVNASPGLIAAAPNNFAQPTQRGSIQVSLYGGYFGATADLVNVTYAGQAVPKQATINNSITGPRSVIFSQDNFQLPVPGLYQATITSNTTAGTPPLFKSKSTNIAVTPNFATFTPSLVSQPLNGGGNPAPSSMAIDSANGYAIITEQGTGTLQLVDLTGSVPTQVGGPIQVGTSNSQPTSVSIDSQLQVNGGYLAAVVASGDAALYLYSVKPPAAGLNATYLGKSINLNLITLLGLSANATAVGTPYAVGIDPGTHLGVVAYSGTNSVYSNIGFIVDVNPNLDGSDTRKCFDASPAPPCVIAPVSMVTGQSPQVIVQPNAPLAYVTPGGSGSISVVDMLQQGTSVSIAPAITGGSNGAVRTAGITKIITNTPHGISPTLGGTVIISGLTTTTANSNFNGTFQVLAGSVIDPYTFSYAQIGQPDDSSTNTASMEGVVRYGSPNYSFSTSATVSAATINPVTRTLAYADYHTSSSQVGFVNTLDQTISSLSLINGNYFGCTTCAGSAPELNYRSVAFDPFTNLLIAYNPGQNVGPTILQNQISLINPGGPGPGNTSSAAYRVIAPISTGMPISTNNDIGQGSYTPSGSTNPVTVYGPMAYDPKSKFVLVASAGSNTLSYMNLFPDRATYNFQLGHVQSIQLFDDVPSYGVPVIQPPLSTSSPAKAPASCQLSNPVNPCMPQAIQVGKNAKIRVLGQGFGTSAGSLVRLDGQSSVSCATNPTGLCTTWVSDSELDVNIPASFLFAPHNYALDVQTTVDPFPSNEMDLYVVGLLDMTPVCATTSAFPQGVEAVAIDDTRHLAFVSNFACNSVSILTVDPAGYKKADGSVASYGTVLSTIPVGKNPLGIGVLPRLGYAVVANNGDSPTGTAAIISYDTPNSPESPKLLSFTPTGSTTPTSFINVGLSPTGVGTDSEHSYALIANNGSNTVSVIDLTVILPSDPMTSSGSTVTAEGHVMTAPSATTIAVSGPPQAIAVDPNRGIAAVTNLQNSGTTSSSAGIDVITLLTNPPVRNSTASVSSLTTTLTGIVYDPGDPNQTTSVPGVFYATSSQQNAIYSFNPDSSSIQQIRVGINPSGVAFNYQTGTLFTINTTSNSSSVVDSQNFKTRQTVGLTSQSQFPVDVDTVTNIATIADQNNNRLIFFALPK